MLQITLCCVSRVRRPKGNCEKEGAAGTGSSCRDEPIPSKAEIARKISGNPGEKHVLGTRGEKKKRGWGKKKGIGHR